MLNQIISRIRRNHALEHATIHLLTDRFKRFGAQGNATYSGFYLNIFGDIPADAIREAADEALQRMKNGEHNLALHPNCGTVHLTTATLATLAAQATYAVEQKRLGKEKMDGMTFINILPTAVLAVFFALIISRPVGMRLQQYTTNGRPGDLQIVALRKMEPTTVARFFRVLLGHNKKIESQSYFIETTN